MRGGIVHFFRAVCLLVFGAAAFAVEPATERVVLIGWGGASRAVVDGGLGRKELPNLQRLIDRGRYVGIEVEGAPDARAGWTQILTGYLPRVTGVYDDVHYQPVPLGLSVFERLERRFGADAFVTAAVIGKQEGIGAIDPPKKVRLGQDVTPAGAGRGTTSGADGAVYRIVPGAPYCNMHSALEVWEYGVESDAKVGARTLELLERYRDKPFFVFVYFAQVGRAGTEPAAYHEFLVANDRWTGRILDKLSELGLADRTQVYVCGDRGFLATNNWAVMRNGRRQDIAATILEAFGFDPNTLAPQLDGISLTQADRRAPLVVKEEATTPTKPASRRPDVVYVPTPLSVVEAMLELAQVKPDDVVYDLGCGDGRIVVTAAERFGCRAFGYDIDPQRVADSLENVAKHGVGDLVTIEQRDIFTLDLSGADVVTLYLLPSLNVKLIPQLEKLKPGSRIVSHDFDMKGVQPDKVVDIDTGGGARHHTVYLWTYPLQKVDTTDPGDDDGD